MNTTHRTYSLIGILAAGACALLAFAAASPAAAQESQTSFQADVTGTVTLPTGCSTGAFFCGTADIAGYGAASWNLFVTRVTLSQTSCGTTYTATTDFTLVSDASTLVVSESGYVCLPGHDGAGWFAEGPKAYGHPSYPNGTWTVDTADSTGQFAGLSGSGTDALHAAGAAASGSYSGTLG